MGYKFHIRALNWEEMGRKIKVRQLDGLGVDFEDMFGSDTETSLPKSKRPNQGCRRLRLRYRNLLKFIS